jgi:NTP pyrophosphatase (non-canonical NTP hydrolase)
MPTLPAKTVEITKNKKLELPKQPTLTDFQDYVQTLETIRGFSQQTALEKCLLLGEEMGELFKAIRKAHGLNIDPQSKVSAVSDELADIVIYLCAIANRFQINLESAFRQKEEINKQRQWTKTN